MYILNGGSLPLGPGGAVPAQEEPSPGRWALRAAARRCLLRFQHGDGLLYRRLLSGAERRTDIELADASAAFTSAAVFAAGVSQAALFDDARPHPVVFGIEDVPSAQMQQPAAYDLAESGHLLVAGAARSGRSTVLRSLTTALAAPSRHRTCTCTASTSATAPACPSKISPAAAPSSPAPRPTVSSG